MEISKILGIQRGITALIGGGGKTTLMRTLARELSTMGTVIVTTSTKIGNWEDIVTTESTDESVIRELLAEHRILCVASRFSPEKLMAPGIPFERLAALADHVLVEADGSRGLPLKAHAEHEPVIPGQQTPSAAVDESTVSVARRQSCPVPPTAAAGSGTEVIYVVGADGFGRPISEVCHRPQRYAALAQRETADRVSPGMAAEVILREGFFCTVYINKTETERDCQNAEAFAAVYPGRVVAGSLHRGEYRCL